MKWIKINESSTQQNTNDSEVKEAIRIGKYFEYMFFSNAYRDYRKPSKYNGKFSKTEVDKMIKSAKNFGFLPSSWKDKADDWIVINIANHSPCGIYDDWSNGASSYSTKAYSPSLNRWRKPTMGEYYNSRNAL